MYFTVERKIKHYSNNHKILLVGDGDFSFAKCLANAFGTAYNITATSLDSEASLMLKYKDARANIQELNDMACTILHQVNVWTMNCDPRLVYCSFDRIVFNFPHAGYFKEHWESVIQLHKYVVMGFVRNAIGLLATNGEIHITHKTGGVYDRWGIVELAEQAGLRLLEKSSFDISEYSGYVNKRGEGTSCDHSFTVGESATFKFVKA